MKTKSAPPPVESSLYDDAYYANFNRGHDQFIHDKKIHPVFYEAVSASNPSAGQTILDIGCGRGEVLVLCAKRGCHAYGIDYSQKAIEIANEALDKICTPSERNLIQVQVMNAKKLTFPDSSIDWIYMLDIVEHLYKHELDEVYKEICRVLKPNGKLLIHTNPNAWCMAPVRMVTKLLGITLKSSPFHINEQTPISLKHQLRPMYIIDSFYLKHDLDFWFNGTTGRGPGIRTIGRIMDWVISNPVSRFIIEKTFLKYIFMSDIWLIAHPRVK